MAKSTLVISAFPGAGKTTLYNAMEELKKVNTVFEGQLDILDSDSSQFSWIEPGVRHPDFPNNYIAHIKENIGKVDVIMTSTHKVVRDALKEAGINFVIVFPLRNLKEEYIERYLLRGSPDGFIKLMNEKWDDFITELKEEEYVNKINLMPGQFLGSILNDSNSMTQQFLAQCSN